MQDYLKQLINWRKNSPVIATGKTLHFAPFDGVYVFFRYNHQKLVMVVMNKNETPINIQTKRFAEILTGKSVAKNVITGEKVGLSKQIQVNGKSAFVYEIE